MYCLISWATARFLDLPECQYVKVALKGHRLLQNSTLGFKWLNILICWNLTLGDVSAIPQQEFPGMLKHRPGSVCLHSGRGAEQRRALWWLIKGWGGIRSEFFPLLSMQGRHVSCWLANFSKRTELCEWTGKDGAACLSPLGETAGSGPWITETSSRNFPFQLGSPQTRKGEACEKARLHASGCFTEILSQALLENMELKHEQKCNIRSFTY